MGGSLKLKDSLSYIALPLLHRREKKRRKARAWGKKTNENLPDPCARFWSEKRHLRSHFAQGEKEKMNLQGPISTTKKGDTD